MIKKIFLDLDDVLNTFTPYVLSEICGRDVTYNDYPVEAGWNIHEAAMILTGNKRFSDATYFWSLVTRKMWASVPLASEFYGVFSVSANCVGRKNVFILTAPTLDPECLAGKLEWIQRSCPDWIKRQYIITPRKEVCAGRGCLLIDDNEDNVNNFTRENCDSDAILIPRPWNKNWRYYDNDYNLVSFINEVTEIDRGAKIDKA